MKIETAVAVMARRFRIAEGGGGGVTERSMRVIGKGRGGWRVLI